MMRLAYLAIVLYLTGHLAWAFARERKFWKQAGTGLVLLLFVLRLLLIQ
jgi:hypothetical protein